MVSSPNRRTMMYWWFPALCVLSLLSLLLQGNPAFPQSDEWPVDPYDKLQLQHTHPVGILDRCLSIRIANVSETLSLDQGIQYLQRHYHTDTNSLRIGMTLYEDNTDFWGLKKGNMHMFHYLEFLVYAYMAFVRIADETTTGSTNASITGLGGTLLEIPWVYAPYLSRRELRGSHGTNQLFTDLAFSGNTLMRGMEDNDDLTQGLHPSFRGVEPHNQYSVANGQWRQLFMTYWREWNRQRRIPSGRIRHPNWQEMTSSVDAVLFIHRHKCDAKGVGQMHAKLADPGVFPAEAWNKDVRKGLSLLLPKEETTNNNEVHSKLTACYIDRQAATDRNMPAKEHEWLLKTLQQHDKVELKHLLMEKYSGLKQIQLASQCDLILGVHGNGLSHELWMPPGSAIVEYYWGGDYVYCYSVLAKMLHHQYLGLWRGKQIPLDRVMNLDPQLNNDLDRDSPLDSKEARRVFLGFLDQEVARFEEKKTRAWIDPTNK